jgi:citrate lyase subunit beta/citryl-CoA lyase
MRPAAARPHAVLAPKVGSADELRRYAEGLAGVSLWAMIETAQGVLRLQEIAAAGPSVLVFGPNDLTAELRLKPVFARAALRPVLTDLALAARVNGLAVLGGAFPGIDDAEAFEAECREEAGFGFDGKTLVHPSQIAPANRAFSPTAEEIAWAGKVVAAFAAPEAAGQGAIRLEGRMLEHLHLEAAERVLRLADVDGTAQAS